MTDTLRAGSRRDIPFTAPGWMLLAVPPAGLDRASLLFPRQAASTPVVT